MDYEPPPKGAAYPRVTFEDAVEYLNDKKDNFSCEICGSNSWQIGINEELTVPVLPIQKLEDFTFEGMIPLVTLECGNCGNLKMFRERLIRNYLDRKKHASFLNDSNG